MEYVMCVCVCVCFVQVRPGIVKKDQEGKVTCRPIISRIVSLQAEQNDLEYAVPGGLIGMCLGVWVCGCSVTSLQDNYTYRTSLVAERLMHS